MTLTIDKILGTSETSLALLKLLAANSFDSIMITDATVKGRIIYANKAFEKLSGYVPSEVIRKNTSYSSGQGYR